MRDILFNTYPEDLFLLQRQIRMRLIDENLMQARIIANPHVDKEAATEFIDSLMAERRWFRGEEEAEPELDREALDALKAKLSHQSKFVGAK